MGGFYVEDRRNGFVPYLLFLGDAIGAEVPGGWPPAGGMMTLDLPASSTPRNIYAQQYGTKYEG